MFTIYTKYYRNLIIRISIQISTRYLYLYKQIKSETCTVIRLIYKLHNIRYVHTSSKLYLYDFILYTKLTKQVLMHSIRYIGSAYGV